MNKGKKMRFAPNVWEKKPGFVWQRKKQLYWLPKDGAVVFISSKDDLQMKICLQFTNQLNYS